MDAVGKLVIVCGSWAKVNCCHLLDKVTLAALQWAGWHSASTDKSLPVHADGC
jgi:hypothetical protein